MVEFFSLQHLYRHSSLFLSMSFPAIATAMSICVAVGNKVVDTRDWHIQWGVPPKYDVFTFAVILATTPYWLWSARIHNAIAVAMSMCVAVGNKVMDTRDWHIQWGVPPKYDVSTLAVIRRRYSPQEVPWRGIHNVIAIAMSMCVAEGNKVVDSPVCLSL